MTNLCIGACLCHAIVYSKKERHIVGLVWICLFTCVKVCTYLTTLTYFERCVYFTVLGRLAVFGHWLAAGDGRRWDDMLLSSERFANRVQVTS